MKKYNIYYGLAGGFGGAQLMEPKEEFEDIEQAGIYAWEMACEDFDSCVGNNGLRDIDEIMEDDEVEEADAQQIYEDERDGWLEYWAVEVDEDGKEISDE